MSDSYSKPETAKFIDPIDEAGYYRTALDSLKGPGSGLRRLCWGFIILISIIFLFCLWQVFTVETIRAQIIYGVLTLYTGMAQISMKIWLYMQMDRRAVTYEIKRLQDLVAHQALSLIHISEPTRRTIPSRMPSSA